MTVATKSVERETAIEDDAFELLHCFFDGVDVFVRQRAVEYAVEQGSFDDDGVTVLVQKRHVQAAGEEACQLLGGMLKQGLPEKVQQAAKMMGGCFQSKTSK